MATERIPSVEEAMDEPSRQKRVTFVNKNLIVTLGGLFVGGLAVVLLSGAIKEDRAEEAKAPPISDELAKASDLGREPPPSLTQELARQKAEVQREDEARRRADEEAHRRALALGQEEPTAPGGYIPSTQQPNADLDEARRRAEEARKRHEESVRTSPLIAVSGSGTGALNNVDLLKNLPPEVARLLGAGAQGGGAEEELRNTALGLLQARLNEAPGAKSGNPTSPLSTDRNKAWLDAYSQDSGTKRPLIRDEPHDAPVVLEGAVIPVTLITEINSDLPGQISAQVTMDVYDSHGRHLLIPRGSRVVGSYSNEVNPGQERVMAAFKRLIRPDGTSVDLAGMPSADRLGQSGVTDQVDNHFWKMFGSSLMIASVAWLAERDQGKTVVVGSGSEGSSTPEKASGQILKDMANKLLQRNTSIPPTLHIRKGHKFNIVVTRDIALPPVAVALRQ